MKGIDIKAGENYLTEDGQLVLAVEGIECDNCVFWSDCYGCEFDRFDDRSRLLCYSKNREDRRDVYFELIDN